MNEKEKIELVKEKIKEVNFLMMELTKQKIKIECDVDFSSQAIGYDFYPVITVKLYKEQ